MTSRETKLLLDLPFCSMEPLPPAPSGGSASRSRASNSRGLRAGLSGAGMEMLRARDQHLHRVVPSGKARSFACSQLPKSRRRGS